MIKHLGFTDDFILNKLLTPTTRLTK